MMTAPLLFISCAVPIKDAQFCSPIPGNIGAVCDNFLTSNQQILDESQWQALQMKWLQAGQATECTTSQTLGDLKTEIEKLCSLVKCDYSTQIMLTEGLNKIQALGMR